MEFKNLSLPVKIGLSVNKQYRHVYPCKEAKKHPHMLFLNSFLKMIHNSMMNLCSLSVLPIYGLFDDLS